MLSAPGPLPLGVSVVDQSIIVFGLVFPRAAQKHRLQMLDHFSKLIKDQAKAVDSKGGGGGWTIFQWSFKIISLENAVRVRHNIELSTNFSEALLNELCHVSQNLTAEALQMNIFTAVLSSLKGLVDSKAKFLADDVKEAAVRLILGALGCKTKYFQISDSQSYCIIRYLSRCCVKW